MERLVIEFESDKDLYQSYMPFLKNGGLFIRTPEEYQLGTKVMLEVALPDSLEASEVDTQVVWITPVGAQNGTPAGIGVAFVKDPDNLRSQIEKNIGRLLNSSEPTFSM